MFNVDIASSVPQLLCRPPLPSGPLAAALEQATAALSDAKLRLPIGFRFAWQDVCFHGRVRETDRGVSLQLLAELARIPFTAEDPMRRNDGLALGRTRTRLRHGAFELAAGSRLVHVSEIAMDYPATGAGVVAAAVQAALRARPYLDLFRPHARSAISPPAAD